MINNWGWYKEDSWTGMKPRGWHGARGLWERGVAIGIQQLLRQSLRREQLIHF